MKFLETALEGVWLIQAVRHEDSRGHFSRTYCETEFKRQGLNTFWPQSNETLTRKTGSIRGMHWQAEPRPEIKLVRCWQGAVWDVAVDLRPESKTFGQWRAFELSAKNSHALYLPAGFAHGFQCLTDDCGLLYLMGDSYEPDLARGFRWDDSEVGIAWPLPAAEMSERDVNLPGFRKAVAERS